MPIGITFDNETIILPGAYTRGQVLPTAPPTITSGPEAPPEAPPEAFTAWLALGTDDWQVHPLTLYGLRSSALHRLPNPESPGDTPRYLSAQGDYLAAVMFNNTFAWYKRVGDTLQRLSTATLPAWQTWPYFPSWSPTGTHLVVVQQGTVNELRVFERTGDTLTLVTSLVTGDSVTCAAWSGDGRYIAYGVRYNTPFTLRLAEFVNNQLIERASYSLPDRVTGVAFGGDSLAVILRFATPHNLRLYDRVGDTLVARSGLVADGATSLGWNGDRTLLAVGLGAPPFLRLYRRVGNDLVLQDTAGALDSPTFSGHGEYLDWHSDYLAVSLWGAWIGPSVKLFTVAWIGAEDRYGLVELADPPQPTHLPFAVAWLGAEGVALPT